LDSALRTCLDQHFDDYEIVVCDHCSSPETRAVVDRFGSSRIKYIRSPKPLAVSDNWDLALSHATGEYVTVLGDDDGLLRHALLEADRLINLFGGIKVLHWDWVKYTWPNLTNAVCNFQ
jgi:glycosyltransferase involved in cell wall biosynthesis